MSYNLINFGNEMRLRRKRLGFTQNELSILSKINIDTIRRIEQGKVLPHHNTLEFLSLALKEDINKLLLEFRVDDYIELTNLKNKLESKFDRDDYNSLEVDLEAFRDLLQNTSNKYFHNLILQLVLLIESVILNKKNNLPEESLKKLITAINLTITNFSLLDYQNYIYNDMEMRILMNIGLLLNKIEDTNTSLGIMIFCMENLDINSPMYPKVAFNLSHTYHRLKDYLKSLEYANKGIDYCMKNRNYNGLNLLYFRKGIAEFHLDTVDYMDSLRKAVYHSELLGQTNVKDMIINNCHRIYGIIL